jgi:hypothetical protein
MLIAEMVFSAPLKPLESQMSNSLLIGYCVLHKLVCSGLCVILQVLALRRPLLHRVLDYEDEFFALLMLVLETHSLRTTGFFLCIPLLFLVLEPSVFVSIHCLVQCCQRRVGWSPRCLGEVRCHWSLKVMCLYWDTRHLHLGNALHKFPL